MVTALSQGRYLGAIVPAFSRLLWPSELSFGRRRRRRIFCVFSVVSCWECRLGTATEWGRSESVQSVQSYSRAASALSVA